jgi:hypothetical protein
VARSRRDYAAEYRRRVDRGLAKGLSRSQARGHPRSAEQPVSAKARVRTINPKLEAGLKALRQKRSLTTAAREAHVAPERLRRYVQDLGFVEKRGGRYAVGTDLRLRHVQFYSNAKLVQTTVRGFDEASLAGSYWDAVHRGFLRTNDLEYLDPYVGKQITDASGRSYLLETRPNQLHRLANAGGESYEQVYRIIV